MKVNYDGKSYEVAVNTTFEEFMIKNDIHKKYDISAVLVNNNLKELSEVIHDGDSVEFLDLLDKDARNIYMRTLSFAFLVALKKFDENAICTIEHSLSNGLFCNIKNSSSQVNRAYTQRIKDEMEKLIKEKKPIVKYKLPFNQASRIYNMQSEHKKEGLLGYRDTEDTVPIYGLDGYKNYFYGYMLPNTSYLNKFDLRIYNAGIVLLGPDIKNPDKVTEFRNQPRLFAIYQEAKDWADVIKMPTALELNRAIENGQYHDIIRYTEAYHEKKICDIVNQIVRENKRIILVAGPSSSGKTSFAQRLKIQLVASKKYPVSISMDNYYIDRDKNLTNDFESINALDIEKFNEDLNNLLEEKEVELPIYDFITGTRKKEGILTSVGKDQPIIIEGIHGLNPILTESISAVYKYRIYVSELTQLNLDNHNRISTTDVRLIRRIIRDNAHRGYGAELTLSMWDKVNEGERNNIFVFQENADTMFNTALIYEIAAMKKYIEPLLKAIDKNSIYYKEAKKILKFTKYFLSIEDESDIPNTSILREFIGGSKLVD
ncbi:nucleoside kinase [Criibacterium bergeronii]|uniref:Nucleoside kinase n=1 Tax=Criibacterium bergeronii TaxID=1871336 RepID=A0A552VCT9_9FIRM|nr:nucleoside kinase [Criibacterium bergeronii]TRW28297.1 nucleoside kinase [Criibacterium bergeronii]